MKYKRFRESGKETKSGDRGEEACPTEMSHSGGSEEGLVSLCQQSNEDSTTNQRIWEDYFQIVIYNRMALLVDPRGRKTVISWRDMVFITEITAGPHPLRSCFYAVYVRAAPAVNIKLFIDADVFFFYKDPSALLVVLEGRHLRLQHLPGGGRGQHRWEAVSDRDTILCMYL